MPQRPAPRPLFPIILVGCSEAIQITYFNGLTVRCLALLGSERIDASLFERTQMKVVSPVFCGVALVC